ncbi:borealin-like [Gymnodraco acuticeps]|uniref:Borealin-like n=1 Tax=Gymnodraco acuticeps TaxID=8218 RepID=A0A6P8TUR6_GYMAC|nr:borealin-like [Gymnodraco acuticeps]
MAPRKTRTTAKARKNSPKTDKLEALLEDFDNEVKIRVGQMKEKLYHLLVDVDKGYNMALLKLPKTLRQMPWMEQFKSEKPKSPEVANNSREEEAAIVESFVAENNPALFQSVKKATKKSAKSTSEDESASGTTRKAKATRKPPTTSKRAKALTVRRLPKTPAVRNPYHKERVYSISVNGSPIAEGNNKDIVINVPIGNGESVQLLASQMDSADLSLLDETALRSIRHLKNRLTVLCGTE